MTAGLANDWQSDAMALLLNILWFVLGGLVMGLGWWLAGVVCAITILGIPFGIQHIELALIALAPIGMQVVPTRRS
jgi:uncharacterized membrane protein YccF (DUF307 family)